jgi:hypothetical protein
VLIAVRLITNEKDNKDNTYHPVDQASHSALMDATGYGWFYVSRWQEVKEQLKEWEHTLTNRWYHIQRRKEKDFDSRSLIHRLDGTTVHDYSWLWEKRS